MKALVIEAPGVVRLRDTARPVLGEGLVRVAVRHVGLCGSDLNTFRGLNPLVSLPRIPGHEIGGEVLEAGPGVSSDFVPGRRVVVMPYTSCGICPSCRKGRVNACRSNRTLGVQQDGGMAEEIVLPAGKLIPNDTLPPRHLALVEPLSVGFHAVARGRVAPGEKVAVLGCGMIGMGAVIGAVAAGAEVVAADVSPAKLDLARRFGAAHVVDPSQKDLREAVAALTEGDGVDVAIEAAGVPDTFVACVDLTGFAGRVVFIGYSKAPVSFETKFFNLKELDLMGSRNATGDDFRAVIAFLEGAGSAADALVSRVFPFAEAEAALPYQDGHRDALKVMVER